MENTTEVETLIASLSAGMNALSGDSPKGAELALAYQRTFNTESGRVVLADLVTRFPIIAPRFVSGTSNEMAAMRDGAAQVVSSILQKLISRPKQEKRKPKTKTGTRRQTERPEDIA